MRVKSYYSNLYDINKENLLLVFMGIDEAQIFTKMGPQIHCLAEDGNDLVQLHDFLLEEGLTEAKAHGGNAYFDPEEFEVIGDGAIQAKDKPDNKFDKPVKCFLRNEEVKRIWKNVN